MTEFNLASAVQDATKDYFAAPQGTSERQQVKSPGVIPAVAAPRQMDIEDAIMKATPFDYLVASEIFAALHKRLELRYEDSLNGGIAQKMRLLAEEFDHLCGTGK